ncbi:unnamed protein product [Closterium sp. NIES-65]|nr:unnamed protein product [Closterium sp. NIES-65]
MDVSSGGDGIGVPKDSAVVVMEDVPFISEPHMHRAALAIIALGGTSAFALSLAAQFTRISTYSILTNPWGALYCSYPPSVATWLAVAAIFVLLFTEAFTLLTGGFTWARPLFTRHVGRGEMAPTVGRRSHLQLALLVFNMSVAGGGGGGGEKGDCWEDGWFEDALWRSAPVLSFFYCRSWVSPRCLSISFLVAFLHPYLSSLPIPACIHSCPPPRPPFSLSIACLFSPSNQPPPRALPPSPPFPIIPFPLTATHLHPHALPSHPPCSLFFLASEGLLIAAAVENSFHISSVPYSTDINTIMYCSTVNEAVFISAAVFAAFSAVLMVAYYILAIKASQDTWLRHYEPAPMVVDMEAFGRDAARTTVASIHGENVGGGRSGRKGGRKGGKSGKGGRKKESGSGEGGAEAAGGDGGEVSVRRVAFATPPAN